MSRITDTLAYDRDQPVVRPVVLGGTGATTPPGAEIELSGVSRAKLGEFNGVASLDSNNKVPLEQLPIVPGTEEPNLDGPDIVYIHQTAQYEITNFDCLTNYVVSVNRGTISVAGKMISYTPANQIGPVILTVNGKSVGIVVQDSVLQSPIITDPINNAIDIQNSPTIRVELLTITGFQDTHLSSTWELATDVNFTNVIASSINDVVHKTEWQLPSLTVSTDYYVRVKQTATLLGETPWSNVVKFTTAVNFFPQTEVAILHRPDIGLGVSTGGFDDYFGGTIALSPDGSVLAIADPKIVVPGHPGTGAVYIYKNINNTWIFQSSLASNGPDPAGKFGDSLLITNDNQTIIVGSSAANYPDGSGGFYSTGAVYIYKTSIVDNFASFSQVQVLSPDQIIGSLNFGQACKSSLNGDILAISQCSYVNLLDQRVYIFRHNGAEYVKSTTIEKPLTYSELGTQFGGDNVSIDLNAVGNRLIVSGMSRDIINGAPVQVSKIHVYDYDGSTWNLTTTFTPDDPAIEVIAWPVKISRDGNTILTGATYTIEEPYASTLYAYEYQNSTWSRTQHIIPPGWDNLGIGGQAGCFDFSADGNTFVVGSEWSSTLSSAAINGAWNSEGVVCLYHKTDNIWSLLNTFQASDWANNFAHNAQFGHSIAISPSGNELISASPYMDWSNNHTEAGAVYVFR